MPLPINNAKYAIQLTDSQEDMLYSKIVFPVDITKCWKWKGGTEMGYGVVRWRIRGIPLSIKVHRLLYTMFYGEPEYGLMVLHKCNNKECVNPTHLYAGNASQNARDYQLARA